VCSCYLCVWFNFSWALSLFYVLLCSRFLLSIPGTPILSKTLNITASHMYLTRFFQALALLAVKVTVPKKHVYL
jgi:hypothetical protein